MKKALMLSSVTSMIKQFNMENIYTLQKLGYDVYVIANFGNPGTIPIEEANRFKTELTRLGIFFYDINMQRNPLHPDNIRAYQEIRKIIKKEKFEIVHCHSPVGGVLARVASIIERKNGTKVIYTAHGFHFFKGSNIYNWLVYFPLEKTLSIITDVLITINKEDYERSKTFFSPKTVYLPGIGINLEKIKSVKTDKKSYKEEFQINEDDFIIVSVGELNDNKNHEVIIKALSLLDINVKFVLCGEGEKKKYLKKLTYKLGLEDNVIFAGYRSDVIKIVKSCDLFVFPSKREGLSVALMEAMACGKPVICSNIRGNTDLIMEANGGFLVNNNAEEYAEKIYEVYSNLLLRQNFSDFNLEFIKKFDKKEINQSMENIYTEVVNVPIKDLRKA